MVEAKSSVIMNGHSSSATRWLQSTPKDGLKYNYHSIVGKVIVRFGRMPLADG